MQSKDVGVGELFCVGEANTAPSKIRNGIILVSQKEKILTIQGESRTLKARRSSSICILCMYVC
jgi:hypothetical protein